MQRVPTSNILSCRSPNLVWADVWLTAGLGCGGQESAETAAEQVGVAGPAGGQIVAVGDGKGWPVVGGSAARAAHYWSALELAARVVQGRLTSSST